VLKFIEHNKKCGVRYCKTRPNKYGISRQTRDHDFVSIK